MRPHKITLTALITLVATISTPLTLYLPAPLTALPTLAQTSDTRKAEADRLHDLGEEQLKSSQFEAALQSFRQALAIYREIKDREDELAALGNLGIVYDDLGDYYKAINIYEQVLAIAREIKDRKSEGKTLGNLGNAYDSLGEYLKAIEYHEQHLAIAQEIKYRDGEGNALGGLGNAYLSLGDYPKTINYHQQSLAIAREIKDRLGESAALGNLGITYYSLGDYSKAIEYHKQQLAIARENKYRQDEGTALGNLGLAYQSLGDYLKAIDYHEQHLAIARKIKDRQAEGAALGNLGITYWSLGDYLKAIDYHEQQLAVAREIKVRQVEGVALGNLGATYGFMGDYPKSIDYHKQRLAIAREIKDRLGEAQALNNLGYDLYKQGNLTLAESTLFEGINVLECLREGLKDSEKVSIFDTQRSIYRTLQKVLIVQNKSDAALEIAERGRARAFVELLASKLSPNPQQQLPPPPTIEQIKQIAKTQNATLVEYSITSEKLFIWVIKPTGKVAFRSVDLKSLDTNLADISEKVRVAAATGLNREGGQQDTILTDLVRGTRDEIGANSSNVAFNPATTGESPTRRNNKRLQQMHQLLIQPIADLLPTDPNSRVIFIPHESLFLVPFAALQDASGKYLIEKHTILIAPAIQVLELTHKQRQRVSGKDVVVVGNPTMPKVAAKIGEAPQQLESLPGAEAEAKAIASLFKIKAITGSAATKAAILQQASTAKIIHLATHGLLNDFTGEGLPGAIALAPTAQDNGLLTSNEILKLKLNAELVILSACNTGRGRVTGDGVIGLSRSLISAGVPSIVVSLWSVPDAPTAPLMTEFYRQLQQNPDKASALRQAMLTTMKQHPKPGDWAAFTLIGEAN